MKKFGKLICVFCLFGSIIMVINKQYGEYLFYFIVFAILFLFLYKDKIKSLLSKLKNNSFFLKHKPYNNIISDEYQIFLNDYRLIMVLKEYTKAKKLPKSNNDVCNYYSYELDIKDANNFVNSLIKKHLLRKVTHLELLSTLSLTELKKIAKENYLSATGNKHSIAERINEAGLYVSLFDNIDEYYIQSDIGRKLYEEKKEYALYHRYQRYNIKPYTLYKYRKKYCQENGYSFSDCIWHALTDNLGSIQDNYSLYISYRNITDFLLLEEKKPNVAIIFCLKYIIYELCGVNFLNKYNWYIKSKEYYDFKHLLFSIENATLKKDFFAPLYLTKEYYNEEVLEKEYNSIKLPINLCSLKVTKEIINKIIYSDFNNIDMILINQLLKQERSKNILEQIKKEV